MDVKLLKDQIELLLKSKFPQANIEGKTDFDFPVFTVPKNQILEILEYLKSDSETGFGFLTTLCGLHFPDDKEKEFGIAYQLHNLEKNTRIRIKIFMDESDLAVPSITGLWPAANWMERQEFDFFGFEFTGHPDLKRILNMDEMNYFPMRKQYPLEDGSRDDKNDSLFGR